MNLVQINERLKDLPMQVLQQYANGMNPEVPPYLALGELQRREIAQKQMATAQGGMQGPQPSVKEQVEQKAGLMAAQALQQQQAMQQMQQPRGPMPVPAGVPQPEPQPEAMARGGLAGIPVRRDMFEYAGGGIIAFAGGGGAAGEAVRLGAEQLRALYDVDPKLAEKARRGTLTRTALIAAAPGIAAELIGAGGAVAANEAAETMRNMSPEQRRGFYQNPMVGAQSGDAGLAGAILNAGEDEVTPSTMSYGEQMKNIAKAPFKAVGEGLKHLVSAPGYGLSRLMEPEKSTDSERAPVQTGTPPMPNGGLPEALKKVAPPAAPARLPAPPAASAPRPAPAAAPAAPAPGLPAAAAQGTSPFIAETAASAREKPVAPTPEGIIAEQAKLLPPAMQEAAVQKMIAEQRARAEGRAAAYEKSKPSGLDDLIRVFGQAGQYKGLSGLAPAETALQQQRRAEDLAFQKQQDELMTAIEGREYGAAEKLFGAREKSLTSAQKSFQDRLMTNTKTLADLAGVDQRRMDEAAQRLNQMQVAKLQAATAARPSEAERIEAKYMGMIAKGQTKEAEEYLNTISKIKGGGAAGVGAGRNAIMERRQTMGELQQIIKDEGMMYSDAEKKQAADQYKRLAMMNANEGDGGAAPGAAPAAAIDALRKNPGLAAQFDQKYGKGAAAQYLQK